MAKYYVYCRELGWPDCSFQAEADSVEQVIEQWSEHGRLQHDLKRSSHELYLRVRPHMRRRVEDAFFDPPPSL